MGQSPPPAQGLSHHMCTYLSRYQGIFKLYARRAFYFHVCSIFLQELAVSPVKGRRHSDLE